jgi:cell division protein FtsI (penicillin-binding protein 3)
MSSQRSLIKEQIKNNSRYSFIFIFCIGILIVGQMINLQVNKKTKLLAEVEKIQSKERRIKATRGNIYAADGKSLLATSVPKYRVGIDPNQSKQKYFDKNIDSLCIKLSGFFGDLSPEQYKEKIRNARINKKIRFVPFGGRLIDHQEKISIQKFPMFRDGDLKGGGKFEKIENRFMPFGSMAGRTIGRLDRDSQSRGEFGVEFSFNNYLSGNDGKGIYERLAGGTWKPINSESDVDAEPGLDVITTLDVNFQDIAESALRNQVRATNAKYGAAIVMEIATGEIKAMTNISKRETPKETVFVEDYNYVVRGGTDPGSTFKLPTMVALLEKAKLKENDFAVDCQGKIRYNNLDLTCSHEHGTLTVKEVFEQSCNVGIFVLMRQHFGFSDADDYIAYLRKFKLDKPVGFQLKGEIDPIIKSKQSQTFSKTTIPWMSIGYETRMTPMQMLTFYNAIANKGQWIQPIIVKEVRAANQVIHKFEANKISEPICSAQTVKLAMNMMKGVVENGTAKGVSIGICKIAGKTGTSQKRGPEGYKPGKYYTAFIGYFPADNPKYSCAVVIDEPVGSNVYAADVCAPVFRQIADKIFAYDIKIHPTFVKKVDYSKIIRHALLGQAEDLKVISDKLGFINSPDESGYFASSINKKDSVVWIKQNEYKESNLPNLIGMTLKDAVPLLENKGYKIKFQGIGKVKHYAIVDKKTMNLVLD